MTIPRRLLPSTSALAAFDSVSRNGSFTLAAQELALTQGAVSRQISGLEELLGHALFDRRGRNVTLTREGKLYADEIGTALQQIQRASLRIMAGDGAGVLRLAVLPTFGTRWLMPRMPRFLAQEPGLTLDLVSRIRPVDFLHEGIDVAIQHGKGAWPGASATRLMDEWLVPVASPAFVAEQGLRSLEDLVEASRLDMHTRPGAWSIWFEAQGLPPPRGPAMRFEQFSVAAQACIAGVGCGLMPHILVRSELERGEMVALGPMSLSVETYHVVEPADAPTDSPGARFRRWLLREVQTDFV